MLLVYGRAYRVRGHRGKSAIIRLRTLPQTHGVPRAIDAGTTSAENLVAQPWVDLRMQPG
jgi:hypothetical protein